MKSMSYDGPLLDAHIHVFTSPEAVSAIQKDYGYAASCVLSLEAMLDNGQNGLCLAYKRANPGSYVFASLKHDGSDFLEQARSLAAAGADGFKMIEGVPEIYLKTGKTLDSAAYGGFYTFLEETGLPLLMHVGNPPEFWEADKAPHYAVEKGRVYESGGFPSLEELRAQTERILSRHPKLKLILAHFFFMGDDRPRAEALLEKYPNLCFDICPGIEMYTHFSSDPAAWRDFFIRHRKRLIFGTDNFDTADPKEKQDKQEINRLVHTFLQSSGEFSVWHLTLRGIDLPQNVLQCIYHDNFIRLTGETPRPLSPHKAG